MHLPPQAAGPNRSHFSYNTQDRAPEKPRSGAELKPQSGPAPALRAGTESLLIMGVVTKHHHRFNPHWSGRMMAHCVNHHPALRVFCVQLSTTESEPQRGPHDSEVDNSEPERNGGNEKKLLCICHTRS